MLALYCKAGAQAHLQFYFDVGENNVSDGLFVRNTCRTGYRYFRYSIEAGVQFDLAGNSLNTFSGFELKGISNFVLHNFPFDLKGFYMLNRISALLYETNWGFRMATKGRGHFSAEVGTNIKCYNLSSYASKAFHLNNERQLREKLHLTYSFAFYLKPLSYSWNVGFSVTTVDYFVIDQPTNPVFNLQLTCPIRTALNLDVSVWYKQAGIFNINANYFGCFIRGGLTWTI